MKPVKYHRLAESELIESALFYESRREFLGDSFLDLVDETLTGIQSNPAWGRPGKFNTRSWKVRRFPFCIVYLEQANCIWIVALARLSRNVGLLIGWMGPARKRKSSCSAGHRAADAFLPRIVNS